MIRISAKHNLRGFEVVLRRTALKRQFASIREGLVKDIISKKLEQFRDNKPIEGLVTIAPIIQSLEKYLLQYRMLIYEEARAIISHALNSQTLDLNSFTLTRLPTCDVSKASSHISSMMFDGEIKYGIKSQPSETKNILLIQRGDFQMIVAADQVKSDNQRVKAMFEARQIPKNVDGDFDEWDAVFLGVALILKLQF